MLVSSKIKTHVPAVQAPESDVSVLVRPDLGTLTDYDTGLSYEVLNLVRKQLYYSWSVPVEALETQPIPP